MIGDQGNLQNVVSKSFKKDKTFQMSESALGTKTNIDSWDKNFLLERKILWSSSICHCVVTEFISSSVDADMEGHLSYETNFKHILNAVVGILH